MDEGLEGNFGAELELQLCGRVCGVKYMLLDTAPADPNLQWTSRVNARVWVYSAQVHREIPRTPNLACCIPEELLKSLNNLSLHFWQSKGTDMET